MGSASQGTHLQQEGQHGRKRPGAGREEGEGTDAVHPQRVVACNGYQPGERGRWGGGDRQEK